MASTCSRCGTTSDDELPSGWSLSTTARGVELVCDRCTRQHVRDIEAKLDEDWWS